MMRHHKRVVADTEEGVRIWVLQGWLRETGSCWRLVVGRLRGIVGRVGHTVELVRNSGSRVPAEEWVKEHMHVKVSDTPPN